MTRNRSLTLAILAYTLLAACQDTSYVARKDTIAFHAGDAIAHNKAIHVIDPWPARSADVRLETSGRRVADAIERYETRANAPLGAPPGLAGSPIAIAP